MCEINAVMKDLIYVCVHSQHFSFDLSAILNEHRQQENYLRLGRIVIMKTLEIKVMKMYITGIN